MAKHWTTDSGRAAASAAILFMTVSGAALAQSGTSTGGGVSGSLGGGTASPSTSPAPGGTTGPAQANPGSPGAPAPGGRPSRSHTPPPNPFATPSLPSAGAPAPDGTQPPAAGSTPGTTTGAPSPSGQPGSTATGGAAGVQPEQDQPTTGQQGAAATAKPPLGSGGVMGEQETLEMPGKAAGAIPEIRKQGGPPVELTKDQEAKLRSVIMSQTIVQEPNANVALRRGARVPSGMNLMSLPPEAEEIVPEYRGYHYVITANRILIVHAESRQIEGMIPA